VGLLNRLKRLGRVLSGRNKKVQVHSYPIDPNSIRENKIIRDQQNQIAELQGIVTRQATEEAAQRESERDYSEETEIKQDLNTQRLDLKKKDLGMFFSWKRFFEVYLNPKNKTFRDNLHFTTWDRTHKIARFGDIGTTSNNKLVILDNKGNVILRGAEAKDIFHNVGALGNDVQALRIPINLDEEGGYVENPMIWKAQEYLYNQDTDEMEFTSSKRTEFYKMLQAKEERIGDLLEKLQEKETALIEMQDKIDDLKLSAAANMKSAQISRNEKTKMAQKLSSIEVVFGQTQEDLVKYQQIYTMQEDHNRKLEIQIAKLLKEAERVGSTPSFDDAIEKVSEVLNVIKKSRMIPKAHVDEVKTAVGSQED